MSGISVEFAEGCASRSHAVPQAVAAPGAFYIPEDLKGCGAEFIDRLENPSASRLRSGGSGVLLGPIS